MSSSHANKARARRGDPLTAREIQILSLVATGERTATIGQRLGISENTVKGHLTHVYVKTGSRNRVQAARHYLEHYTTPPPPSPASQPASDGRSPRAEPAARS
jgi:DNA-binding CsgD family transcriptional regulator